MSAAEVQYFGTLVMGIAYTAVSCISLAEFTRARWKWIFIPVFLVGLALLITWGVTAWAGAANSGWLFYDAPVIIPVVKVGG